MKQIRIMKRDSQLKAWNDKSDSIPMSNDSVTVTFERTLSNINLDWLRDQIDDYYFKYRDKPKEILVGFEIYKNLYADLDRVTNGMVNLIDDSFICEGVNVRLIASLGRTEFKFTHRDNSMTFLEAVGEL